MMKGTVNIRCDTASGESTCLILRIRAPIHNDGVNEEVKRSSTSNTSVVLELFPFSEEGYLMAIIARVSQVIRHCLNLFFIRRSCIIASRTQITPRLAERVEVLQMYRIQKKMKTADGELQVRNSHQPYKCNRNDRRQTTARQITFHLPSFGVDQGEYHPPEVVVHSDQEDLVKEGTHLEDR